jgi:hypothetical protein
MNGSLDRTFYRETVLDLALQMKELFASNKALVCTPGFRLKFAP